MPKKQHCAASVALSSLCNTMQYNLNIIVTILERNWVWLAVIWFVPNLTPGNSVNQWSYDCGVRGSDNWPANSPDVSSIENLWLVLKGNLKSKHISTLTELEMAIKEFQHKHLNHCKSFSYHCHHDWKEWRDVVDAVQNTSVGEIVNYYSQNF